MSCPDCTTGGILPGEPTGHISSQGAYFAAAPSDSPNPKHTIILLTDGFGLNLKNSKILADNFAKELRCDVWVPDYFDGQPLVPLSYFRLTPTRAGVHMSILRWIKAVLFAIPRIPALWASRPTVADERIEKFVRAIKEEKRYETVGVIGYCYGGSAAIRTSSRNLFNSAVICHPGPTSIAEIKAISVPVSWVCAEDDVWFGTSMRLKTEAAFAERRGTDKFVEYEFVVYKGTAHGFAARPDLEVPEIKEGQERAFQQAVAWFKKSLTN